MDTVTIGILLFWTPNIYNYLALRNLLSVLVYYLISLNFGIKTGQCQSNGQLSVVTSYHTRTMSLLETLLTMGYSFWFLSCQCSIAAGVVGDYSILHVHSVLCLSLPWAMLTGVQRVCPRRPSTFHTSHFSLSNQLLHYNSPHDA